MKTLKTVIATLIVVAILVPMAVLAVIYSGAYNVAATEKHWSSIHWLLSTTVQQSIAEHAKDIAVPALGARQQVLAGAANYQAMCAGCHAAPGIEQRLPGVAMYPQPPRLDHAAKEMTAAELFWVIKHGIKASGMPGWGPSHSREEIWSMVAFIQQLPPMSATEYKQLLKEADTSGMGHHHQDGGARGESDTHSHGMEHAHDEKPAIPANTHEKTDPAHETGGHPHGADGHSH